MGEDDHVAFGGAVFELVGEELGEEVDGECWAFGNGGIRRGEDGEFSDIARGRKETEPGEG